MRKTSKDSLFTCGKGQMYLLEAIIAAFVMLGAAFFMVKLAPLQGCQEKEFSTLQLKKYADDILEILSMENTTKLQKSLITVGNDTTLLYKCVKKGVNGNWSSFDKTFYDIGKTLKDNLSIMYKVEVFKFNKSTDTLEKIHCNGTEVDVSNSVSSFRIVIVNGEVYEVRLTLWYI